MTVEDQVDEYLSSQPEPKRNDLLTLHQRILKLLPGAKLWFLDGKNPEGKKVANPNIGYGMQTMKYTDGSTREFYQIGFSANTAGISLYIIGLEDKKYLATTYAEKLGKATVTGYCIKFKALKDIKLDVLDEAIQYGVAATH